MLFRDYHFTAIELLLIRKFGFIFWGVIIDFRQIQTNSDIWMNFDKFVYLDAYFGVRAF